MTLYLLGVNLLVLGIGLGVEYLSANRPSELHEFNAGKIRFWAQPDAYKPAQAEKSSPAPEVAAPAPEVPPAISGNLCLEIADFSQARYQEFRTRMKNAGLDDGQCTFAFDKRLAWWVFWPPEYEAAQREKVLKAIQAAGVKDVLPITQGAMAQSLSLGVFAGEAQANQYRDTLRGKGLSKVEFGPRPSMGTGRLICRLKNPARRDGFLASLPGGTKTLPEDQCLALVPLVAAVKPPLR